MEIVSKSIVYNNKGKALFLLDDNYPLSFEMIVHLKDEDGYCLVQ
jgi:hypothetical protein